MPKTNFTLADYKRNEDINFHMENAIELVAKYGTPTQLIEMTEMKEAHLKQGSLTREQTERRREVSGQYYQKLVDDDSKSKKVTTKPRTRSQLLKADLVNSPATRQELAKAFLDEDKGSRKIHGRSSNTNSNQRDVGLDLGMSVMATPPVPIQAQDAYDAELQKMWLRRTNEYDIVGIDEPTSNPTKRLADIQKWAGTPMTPPTTRTTKRVSSQTTTQTIGTPVVVPPTVAPQPIAKSQEELDAMRDEELDSLEAVAQGVESEMFGVKPDKTTAIPITLDEAPVEVEWGFPEFANSGLESPEQEADVVAMVDTQLAQLEGDKNSVLEWFTGKKIINRDDEEVELTEARIRMAFKVIETKGSLVDLKDIDAHEGQWRGVAGLTQRKLDKSTKGL